MKVKIRMFIKILKSPRGFTLIETLISMMLVCVMAIACAGLVSYFARYTRQDTINSCLLQAASSGIEAKRADPGYKFHYGIMCWLYSKCQYYRYASISSAGNGLGD